MSEPAINENEAVSEEELDFEAGGLGFGQIKDGIRDLVTGNTREGIGSSGFTAGGSSSAF